MRDCATGSTLFWKKNAPTATTAISTISERMMRKSDMPAAFMAVSSNFSPRLPNTISEANSTANGRAMGTKVSAA